MRDGLVYATASLCLGWIAVWASEILFWTTPAVDLGPADLLFTWAGYSVVSAAALSVVLWSRLTGWRAAFLGGALLGFGIEGALVATMYDAFPLQLVWTPLAWHALVSGLAVLGGAFAFSRGGIARQAAWLLMLGLFGAGWGLYWPTEGKGPAGFGAVLAYQAGGGLGVGLALGVLTRLPRARQAAWWLWIAPLAVAALWVLGTALSPDMVRLAGPVMALATVWAMRRLGRGAPGPVFGPPIPWARAFLFVLAPATSALLVTIGWAVLGGVPVNGAVAVVSGVTGLGLWGMLLVRAACVRP